MEESKVKKYYDFLGKNYLESFGSLAKKDISYFESGYIDKQVKETLLGKKSLKVLEIGFGPGRIAGQLLKYPIEYYGIDISEEMTRNFKKKFSGNKKVKGLMIGDASATEFFEKEQFDLIVAMRVLYYSKNWKQTIEKLIKKLGPSGGFVFSMPNKYSLSIIGNFFGEIKGYYTTFSELEGFLKKYNLMVEIIGFARISDIVYDLCNNKLTAKLLNKIENFLRLIFGRIFLTKMFYVTVKKISSDTKN